MLSNYRRVLAVFHGATAVSGIAALPYFTTRGGALTLALLVAFVAFLASSAWTAYLLWTSPTAGRAWSMTLLVAQLPKLVSATVSYSLVGLVGVFAQVSTDWNLGFSALLGTEMRIYFRSVVEVSTLGLNLTAVALLALWSHAGRVPDLPAQGGLVTR